MRVLVAENHPDLSEAVARIVDTEPDMLCVGQVANVSEVLPVARESSAQALVLDLSLTGGSSLQLIEELIAGIPGLHIVVFSGLANAEEAEREIDGAGHDRGECAGPAFRRDAIGRRETERQHDRGIGTAEKRGGAEQPE